MNHITPDDIDGASRRLLSENRDIYIIQSANTVNGKVSSFKKALRLFKKAERGLNLAFSSGKSRKEKPAK